MYAVIGLFDERTEKAIKGIWRDLKDQSISFYADQVVDRIPHITLASYNSLNKDEMIADMDRFYEKKAQLDIAFQTIGSFLNSGALFLNPVVTKELLDFHIRHHEFFDRYNDGSDSLYLPSKWIPHCTVANRLTIDKLSEAYAYCMQEVEKISGKITNIALIELLDEKNAPVIYSKELQADSGI